MQKMNIVYKRLDELRPYENNAKTHPETQLANIAHSIENYGWKQPVVIRPLRSHHRRTRARTGGTAVKRAARPACAMHYSR